MTRPLLDVFETFTASVGNSRHKKNQALKISVAARDATAARPFKVLVLRLTSADASLVPHVPDVSPQSTVHGRNHTSSAAVQYTFPVKGVDCTQRIIVMAWDKQRMIDSPSPADVEVRHLALTFEGT